MYSIKFMTLIFFFILVFSSGCFNFGKRPDDVIADEDTSTEISTIIRIIRKTDWIVTLSILVAGAGFFAFLNGNGIGLKLMATAFVVLGIVLMLARFATLVAVIALSAAVLLLFYTIFIKSKALREIVVGVESARKKFASDVPEIKAELDKTLSEQSESTKTIVKTIKQSMD
jgi:low affinity Fe/Cu permease